MAFHRVQCCLFSSGLASVFTVACSSVQVWHFSVFTVRLSMFTVCLSVFTVACSIQAWHGISACSLLPRRVHCLPHCVHCCLLSSGLVLRSIMFTVFPLKSTSVPLESAVFPIRVCARIPGAHRLRRTFECLLAFRLACQDSPAV